MTAKRSSSIDILLTVMVLAMACVSNTKGQKADPPVVAHVDYIDGKAPEPNNVPITLSFWKDTAYLTNEHKAALDDLSLNLDRDAGKVAIIVGCALTSERNATLLSIIRAYSAREWVVGQKGIKLSRVLLRSCNRLSPAGSRNSREGGVVSIYLVSPEKPLSDRTLDVHEVSIDAMRQQQAAIHADYEIAFDADSTNPRVTTPFQQIALDGQTHEVKGYILSVSCSFHELDCSEMDLRQERLGSVRRLLVKAGIDSRRISDEFHDDGTSSVKIFVVRDVNLDIRLPNSRNIAEAPPGDFLRDLLQSLHVTFGTYEYQELRKTFEGCKAVSVLYYPPTLNLGWDSEKGVVRLLIGNLKDSQFQRELQALDARKYLPFACLYGDTERFPQFQIPPSGLSVRRLAAYTTIQKVAPLGFTIDPQVGDSTGRGSYYTDQSWTVSPGNSKGAAFEIALADGTHLPVPILIEEKWTYQVKKLWTIIVALAGIGLFGGLAKLLAIIKRNSKPKDES